MAAAETAALWRRCGRGDGSAVYAADRWADDFAHETAQELCSWAVLMTIDGDAGRRLCYEPARAGQPAHVPGWRAVAATVAGASKARTTPATRSSCSTVSSGYMGS